MGKKRSAKVRRNNYRNTIFPFHLCRNCPSSSDRPRKTRTEKRTPISCCALNLGISAIPGIASCVTKLNYSTAPLASYYASAFCHFRFCCSFFCQFCLTKRFIRSRRRCVVFRYAREQEIPPWTCAMVVVVVVGLPFF